MQKTRVEMRGTHETHPKRFASSRVAGYGERDVRPLVPFAVLESASESVGGFTGSQDDSGRAGVCERVAWNE